MAEWERRERHELVRTGPAVVDGPELVAELNRAFSDYWLIANEEPHSPVPAGAVTVSAAGGVITVRIEHVERVAPEPAGDQLVEAMRTGEDEG